MITLEIPIVFIIKALIRIWQFFGMLFTIGMCIIFLSASNTCAIGLNMNYLIGLKVFLLFGAVFVFSEWITDRDKT